MDKRMETVRKLAREENLLNAIIKPVEEGKILKDKHFEIFAKLDVLAQLRYPSDFIAVTDIDGVELARTASGKWYKERWADKYKVVRNALKGIEGEDIWKVKGRISIVNCVPLKSEGKVLGALIVANGIDEELARAEKVVGGSNYAFFSKDRIISSTITSVRQAQLNDYFLRNSDRIAKVLLSRGDYFKETMLLGDETYDILLAPMTSIQEKTLAGFAIIRSVSHHLRSYSQMRTYLFVVSLLFVLLGIPLALLILQQAYDTIDFILEGAHQIVIGNKDYQFSSEDPDLVGLGQAMNLMIAILLGKYIPEDEDEMDQMALKGAAFSRGKAKAAKVAQVISDPVLIETMNEADEKSIADAGAEDRDAHYKRLFDEFIKAKMRVGDDVSMVTKDRLRQKLERTEAKLCEKHGVKSVRFEVHVDGKKVTLKPFPVKD